MLTRKKKAEPTLRNHIQNMSAALVEPHTDDKYGMATFPIKDTESALLGNKIEFVCECLLVTSCSRYLFSTLRKSSSAVRVVAQ